VIGVCCTDEEIRSLRAAMAQYEKELSRLKREKDDDAEPSADAAEAELAFARERSPISVIVIVIREFSESVDVHCS